MKLKDMDNNTKIPLKVIENWYKERMTTMIKNFQSLEPDITMLDPEDPNFLNGAWNAARIFLETEYERYVKAIEEVHNV
jgi:hypothetical protein